MAVNAGGDAAGAARDPALSEGAWIMSAHTHGLRPAEPRVPYRHQDVHTAAEGLKQARLWTAAVVVLALGASLAGLLVHGVYTGEASTAEMLRGYDLVTAVVIVPALAVATWATRHGSAPAQLVSASLIAYLVYTYAYYVFGTGFNDLFLVHIAIVATSVVALVLHLSTVDVAAFAPRVRSGAAVRGAATVLGVLATALGSMWIYFAVDNAVTGDIPAGSRLVETETIVHLGMALDLALLVPLYAAAGLLLWRRSAWGYVLGVMCVIAGVLHQLSYVVAMPFQVAAGIPGAVSYDPGEPVIVLLYLLGAALLLRRGGARAEEPTGVSRTL